MYSEPVGKHEQKNGVQDAETEGTTLRMWRQEEGRTARVSLMLGRKDSMLKV